MAPLPCYTAHLIAAWVLECDCIGAGLHHCDKQQPMHAGILANMACHPHLQGKLAGAPRLQQAVLQALLTMDDAGCICEACRLLSAVMAGSHVSAWLSCITKDLGSRVTWLLEATQNSDVLERCSPHVPGRCAGLSLSNGHALQCTHEYPDGYLCMHFDWRCDGTFSI